MRRVMVIGCGGSGKSTFAARLAEGLHLPLIALDFHYWRAGWQQPPADEWRAQVAQLAAGDAWIMEGNYSGTFDLRMLRADTLIWLDYPTAVCMRRVLLRAVKGYARARPGLPQGCPERFDWAFLRHVWNFRQKHRPRILVAIERFGGHLRLHRLARDRDGDELLTALGAR
jgi:adenylate kinase family enzyme